MLSPTTQAILTSAMAAASQRRAAQGTVTAGGAQTTGPRKGAGRALSSPKRAPKRKPAPRSPGAPRTTSTDGPEVAPYLRSEDLMALGERTTGRDLERIDREIGFKAQAAKAARDIQDSQLARVKGLSSVEDNAAARGLLHSSIRDGNLDAVDSAAARQQSAIRADLAQAEAGNTEYERRAAAGDQDFLNAIAAKAAENAAAVPRAARDTRPAAPARRTTPARPAPAPARRAAAAVAKGKRKGGNVRGAATLRRGASATLQAGGARPSGSIATLRPGR